MQESFVFSDSSQQSDDQENNQTKADLKLEKSASQKLENTALVDSTYWFACDDFHHSRLIISAAQQDTVHELTVYDSTGELVNKVQVKLKDSLHTILDLDIIAAGCSIQSGLRHGTIRIVSPSGTRHELNVFCSDKSYRATENFSLSKQKAVCFPLMICQDSNTTVLFAVADGPESTVKVRLYTGTRSPEVEFKLSAYSAKILNIETDFADFLNLSSERPAQAYVRIISNTANNISVRLLEKSFNAMQASSEELE